MTPERRARAEVERIVGAADAFRVVRGHWPTMAELREPNAGGAVFLKGFTEDPWGHPFRLVMSPDGKTVTANSAGPDGVPGTTDDIAVTR
jgi:hypothetical protein